MALDNELIHGTEFLFNFFLGGWSSYSFLQHASPVDQLWDTLQGFHWGWKGQPLQPNLMCVCLGCLYNSSVKIGIWWIWCCWFSVCWLNPHFLLVKFPFAVSWIPVCGFFAPISCWSPQVTLGHPQLFGSLSAPTTAWCFQPIPMNIFAKWDPTQKPIHLSLWIATRFP